MQVFMKKKAVLIRCLCFFVILFVILSVLADNLRIHGISDSTENGFFNQQEGSFDVLYIGNCHAYTSIRPSLIEEKTGLRGYVLAGSNLDAKMTYYYLKAALSRQRPEYVVLEVFPFAVDRSYITEEELKTSVRKNAADLPWKDRINFIIDEVRSGEKDWLYYLFDIGFFHENWSEFELFGAESISSDNGWSSFGDNRLEPVEAILCQDKQSYECFINEKSEYYFNRIIDMLKEANIRLVLLASPYIITNDEIPVYNWISEYADENQITFLNMTNDSVLEKAGFRREYMNDSRHVNPNGAEIVSAYLSSLLKDLR